MSLPAVIAAFLAYRKSEKAERRAELANQLLSVCRFNAAILPESSQNKLVELRDEVATLVDRISAMDKEMINSRTCAKEA